MRKKQNKKLIRFCLLVIRFTALLLQKGRIQGSKHVFLERIYSFFQKKRAYCVFLFDINVLNNLLNNFILINNSFFKKPFFDNAFI